ncbi:hypothetical protein M513_03483, partial [Trichuris suis]
MKHEHTEEIRVDVSAPSGRQAENICKRYESGRMDTDVRYSQLAACFTCTTNVVSIMWHKAFILLAMMQKLDMKVPFAYPIHDMVANKQLS